MSTRFRPRVTSTLPALIAILLSAAVTGSQTGGTAVGSAGQQQRTSAPPIGPGQQATELPDGRWLLTGGQGTETASGIWDPATGVTVTTPGSLQTPRAWHTATVLPDGTVLIAGGTSAQGEVLSAAERFLPSSGRFEPIPETGLLPRSHHSATLLTDGRVLFAGGTAASALDDADLFDPQSNTATQAAGLLAAPRSDHSATLLPDGRVRLSGGKSGATGLREAEVFDPDLNGFVGGSAPAPAEARAELSGSTPRDGAIGVPVDVRLALRFSEPLAIRTITDATIVLSSAAGRVPASIVPAEGGRLVFVRPAEALSARGSFTLTVSGVIDREGRTVEPATVTFETAADDRDAKNPQPAGSADDEAWAPQNGEWTTGRGRSPWQSLPPLQGPAGVTSLAGQVLRLNAKPLVGVTVRIGTVTSQTDGTGRFLLVGVPSGRVELVVDARQVSRPGKTYGMFMIAVDVNAKQTTPLPFTIWVPVLDTEHATALSSPTVREVVATTPLIPNLEVHVSPGAILRNPDGQVVTEMTITPIPIDRPPFPLPRGVRFPTYFTLQPGGSRVEPATPGGNPHVRILFPNASRAPAGSRIDFWSYDSNSVGWFVYGQGTVSADGRHIVPDAGVTIRVFTCASIGDPTTAPAPNPQQCNNCTDGEPVDLGTGLFVYDKTDLVLPDTIPIVLTRTYRTKDMLSREFGIGFRHSYDWFLVGDAQGVSYAELILPDGARIHYDLISAPGTPTLLEHTSTPSIFYKSKLELEGGGGGGAPWRLTLLDGTVYHFKVDGTKTGLDWIMDRFGNQVRIFRDANFRITRILSPNGKSLEFSYNGSAAQITQVRDSLGRTVSYTYDGSGRLWKVTDAAGGVTEFTYDTSHRMKTLKDPRSIVYLTNDYDANGRVMAQTQADGSTYQFAYTVDGTGKVTQTDVTDPLSIVRRVTFNGAAYWLTDTLALNMTEQQTVTFERDTSSNRVSAVIDSLNRRTEYSYDAFGNVSSVARLAGRPEPAIVTSATYTADFQQIWRVTDPLQHQTTFGYDARGALTSVTDPLQHQLTSVPIASGLPASVTDGGGTTQFTYDGGDLVSVLSPLGFTAQRFVDGGGRGLTLTNPLGQIRTLTYNALNQPLTTTDALQAQTQFSYDPNGNLLTVTDARTGLTQYTYDDMDRAETRTDPLLRIERYSYDVAGRLTTFTDRKNQVTTYRYDALGRLTGATHADGSMVTYTYDAGNRLRNAVDSVSGTIVLDYDDLDRLTTETTYRPGEQTPRSTITYTYDDADRRRSMTVAGQPAVTYDYDDANRLTTITQGSSVVTFEYDAADRRTALVLPNGVRVEYGYDAASQLIGVTYKLGQAVLGTLTYAYDGMGRRTSMGGSWARTLLPDAVVSTNYDAANRLTQWAGTTLTYDENGNLLSDGSRTYGWDARNRLSALSGLAPASFAYDPVGRRVSKSVAGGTTEFVYDGLDSVQELVGGTATANVLLGPGIDEVLQRADAVGVWAHVTDAIGSAVASLDPTGAVQRQYTYSPFGITSATGEASANPSQFTGRENDPSGLYYYRARYYDPSTRRFLSEDPARPMDQSAYAYVENDPVNYTDPSGWYRVKICLNTMKLILTDNNGKPIFCANVKAGGCPTTPTPRGKFTLGAWQQDKTSPRWGNGSKTKWSDSWFGYNVFGAYFVPINGTNGVGIHGRLGNGPVSEAVGGMLNSCSHGCVRLTNDDITQLHNMLPHSSGTPVTITDQCTGKECGGQKP